MKYNPEGGCTHSAPLGTLLKITGFKTTRIGGELIDSAEYCRVIIFDRTGSD
jgi:hypothetical protein